MSFRNMLWFYKEELTAFLHGNNNALSKHEKERLFKHGILSKTYIHINHVRKPEYRLSKKTLDILQELQDSSIHEGY